MLYALKKNNNNFLSSSSVGRGSQFENLGYSRPLITLPVTFVCLAGSSALFA